MINTVFFMGILAASLSGVGVSEQINSFAGLFLFAHDAICRGGVPAQEHDQNAIPLLPAPSQDPWIVRHGNLFYYSESKGTGIAIRETRDFMNLARAKLRVVWKAPAAGPCSRNIWAPELHFLRGRWYLYFAADDGRNENHRMWVIRSETDSPFGPYGEPTLLETEGWAIDGTLLQSGHELYFFWSGWPGTTDGLQNLYGARMADPITISSPRVLLAEPTEPWERHVMPLCEGPQLLHGEGKLFIVYSASASWTRHYRLGMLVNTGGNILDPAAWRKVGPVFEPTDSVWGVGHCSFITSTDGSEDWIFYHAKTTPADGWGDRSVR
ncbi:MAG: glycoside hydrolase family 43 protein, partial [Bacteroidota bacterium]